MPEAPGYVLAHCFFTERVDVGQGRITEGVLF
jgi:hypothetical protein